MAGCLHEAGAHAEVSEAFDELTGRVRVPTDTVDGSRWRAATPCRTWSVRDLVNHVAAELLRVPAVVAGEDHDRCRRRFISGATSRVAIRPG